MFAEECGSFFRGISGGIRVIWISRNIQRCAAIIILCIHIRTSGNKQFGDFLVAAKSRLLQRSVSKQTTHSINIRASIQVLFNCFNVSIFRSLVNIHTRPTPHQHQGCDCD